MNEQSQKSEGAPACQKKCCGAASCLFICATIAFIAYLFITPHSAQSPRLWIPVVVETNGDETILGETRQMEFWTPSAKTMDYLHKENGRVVATEKWEVISNDDAVVQFGMMLHSNLNVLGYRRVEVWGQGRTGFKPGWWWTMNVLTNYTTGNLARTYQDFWKSQQTVFVEVIDSRGTSEQ